MLGARGWVLVSGSGAWALGAGRWALGAGVLRRGLPGRSVVGRDVDDSRGVVAGRRGARWYLGARFPRGAAKLKSQGLEAAQSAALNTAEGRGRAGQARRNHYEIAYASASDLVQFIEKIAKRCPEVQVHVVWDNLNIHYDGKDARWTRFNERHGGRFHFRYTPIHASWLNQIEIWFGILQRRVIKHGVHDSLDQLDEAVMGFIQLC